MPHILIMPSESSQQSVNSLLYTVGSPKKCYLYRKGSARRTLGNGKILNAICGFDLYGFSYVSPAPGEVTTSFQTANFNFVR